MSEQKILVIDDDRTTREMVSEMLSQNEYTVICAENGKTGLKMAQRENPNAIILDMIMPDMDGNDVLKKLKTHPDTQPIPVMILTGRDKSKDISTSLQLGAKDYIVKPFDTENMLIRVKILLGNK